MKKEELSVEEHITKLEKSLMAGRGRWIADFNESFRNFRIKDVVFDAFIQGNTRMKGFLLSRLFSFLTNPNYSVNCFILSTKSTEKIDQSFLTKVLATVKAHMKDNEIKWSWLFIFGTGNTRVLEKKVEKIDDRTLGVALVNIDSRQIIHSNSYLGKQAKNFIKM